MPKQVKKDRELSLLKEIEELLYERDWLENDEAFDYKVGDYIKDNLKHKLRPYQNQAIYSLNYTQTRKKPNKHILFNMATGSGKTDTMAAAILYMYTEFGYQNFLFVVNTNAVVSKTKENFLNTNSAKYLFNDPIMIDGQRIEVKSVNRFPNSQEPGTIYLRLTTIQTLANELNSFKENGLTFEELEKTKLVILADEAHHFNSNTKSKKGIEEKSWEILLDKIRQSNPENRQFEFTATINLDKDEVYQKYRDKIAFKYDLDKFMNDGYSKNVYRLESQNDDETKMLNAVLLSQYRKRIAKENGIDNFKPVILFKSNQVKQSLEARDNFLDMISNLNASSLAEFLITQKEISQSLTLTKTYKYWIEQDMAQTVVELQRDFKPLTTINANDTSKKGLLEDKNDFNNLNTLEDINNPIRTVFAVAKLTEGWDVLNLYDIVRIGEQSVTVKQTDSEAQLIGRGARYNPFIYQGERSFVRRFKNNDSTELNLLESLYYHTINDVKYISNLVKSFDKMNLVSESDNPDDFIIHTAEVKESFKKSNAYKYGKLYHNQLEEVPETEYNNLAKYGFNRDTITIDMNDSTIEHERQQESKINERDSKDIVITDLRNEKDLRILKKAMSRDKFFRYAELSKWIPTIDSLDEFMSSENWLGNLKIVASIPYNKNYDQNDNIFKLKVIEKALTQVKNSIKSNFLKKRGTNKFDSVNLKDVVVDYKKRVSTRGTTQSITKAEPMGKDSWFVYDNAIVDGLEKSLIELIRGMIEELKAQYKEVYLIRNEETVNKLKLYEFDNQSEVAHYEGFLPDFILYLDDGSVTYQLFIEPKGDQLKERDSWKEALLKKIKPENIELMGENKDVRLYGIKFYSFGNGREIEEEISNIVQK